MSPRDGANCAGILGEALAAWAGLGFSCWETCWELRQPGSSRISVATSLVDLVHEMDVLSVAFRVI